MSYETHITIAIFAFLVYVSVGGGGGGVEEELEWNIMKLRS